MLGTFRIGEDMTIALDTVRGVAADVTNVVARIAAAYRENGPLKGAAQALTVTERDATDDYPAGWIVTMPAADTADLTPGVYAIDVQAELDGAIEITAQTSYVRFTSSVFG